MAHQIKVNCSNINARAVVNNLAKITHYCGTINVPLKVLTPKRESFLTLEFENEADLIMVQLTFPFDEGMLILDKALADGVNIQCQ